MSALAALHPWRTRIDDALAAAVQQHADLDGTPVPTTLRDAIAWSLLAGGKRLRPLVCLCTARALDPQGRDDDALWTCVRPAMLALEMVHTYSLIHDDLPALDDDDLRRGRKTLHRQFDEATAILAGDALLTDAFAVLADAPLRAAAQVKELALAAGGPGMVGGQFDDIGAEGRAIDVNELRVIHARKTGRLFGAAAALGALSVNADDDGVARARAFGHALGFAFQVQDDVLDVTGDVDKGGKTRGRDLKHDKSTYVRLLGLDGARALANDAGARAVNAARALATDAARTAVPVELARFAAQRDH